MQMRFLVCLIFCLGLTTASARDMLCSDAKNTIEDRDCMSAEIDKADHNLAEYLDAATERISKKPDLVLSRAEEQKAYGACRGASASAFYNNCRC